MNTIRYIFVDGYNVINAWPELKELTGTNLEEARYKLIDMLQDYAVYRDVEVYVVFDAHYVKGSFEKNEKYKRINVVYTKEGESADCYIERSVVAISKRAGIAVVTSDYLEQRIVLQMGGIRITPSEFLLDIKKSKVKIKEKSNLQYSEKKNTLENYLDVETLKKLEKLRRNL